MYIIWSTTLKMKVYCLVMMSPCCFCFQGTSVVSPILPIGIVVMLALMIWQKSTTHLFELHPCLYVLGFGMVVTKVTIKLVVSTTFLLLQSPSIFNQYSAMLCPYIKHFNHYCDLFRGDLSIIKLYYKIFILIYLMPFHFCVRILVCVYYLEHGVARES